MKNHFMLFLFTEFLENHLSVMYLADVMSPNPNYNATTKKGSANRVDISMLYEYFLSRHLPAEMNQALSSYLINWRFAIDLSDESSLMYTTSNVLSNIHYRPKAPDILIGPQIRQTGNLKGYVLLNNILHINHGLRHLWKAEHTMIVQPVDRYRMDVLLRLFKDLGWNYFSVYWSPSMIHQLQFFTDLEAERKVCISSHIQVPKEEGSCQLLDSLKMKRRKHVILLLFTTPSDSRRLLSCMKELDIDPHSFTLVFFHNHNSEPTVYQGFEKWVDGSLGIRSKNLIQWEHNRTAFEENVFKRLHPKTNPNKVLRAYWESRNNCFGNSGLFERSDFERDCTFGDGETLEPVEGWNHSYHITESVSQLPFIYVCLSRMMERLWEEKCFPHFYNDKDFNNCTRSYIGADFNELLLKAVARATKNTFSCNALKHEFAFDVINSQLVENVTGVNGKLVDFIEPVPVYEWWYEADKDSKYLYTLKVL